MRTDRDPNRGKRRIPLSWFSAADLLGLNDDEPCMTARCSDCGPTRVTTNEELDGQR